MNELLNLTLTRDSVSAGDDSNAPHLSHLNISIEFNLAQVLTEIRQLKFLPGISGNHATWIVEISGSVVAVVAQEHPEPLFIVDRKVKLIDLMNDSKGNVRFRYWCQTNPKLVVECIKSGKPLPNKY